MKKRLNLLPKQDAQKPTGELRREARLARIAGALASGASITDIAATEGISRVIASREANSPNCRQLIATFVRRRARIDVRTLLPGDSRNRGRVGSYA